LTIVFWATLFFWQSEISKNVEFFSQIKKFESADNFFQNGFIEPLECLPSTKVLLIKLVNTFEGDYFGSLFSKVAVFLQNSQILLSSVPCGLFLRIQKVIYVIPDIDLPQKWTSSFYSVFLKFSKILFSSVPCWYFFKF
jgi:hypothetical protein